MNMDNRSTSNTLRARELGLARQARLPRSFFLSACSFPYEVRLNLVRTRGIPTASRDGVH